MARNVLVPVEIDGKRRLVDAATLQAAQLERRACRARLLADAYRAEAELLLADAVDAENHAKALDRIRSKRRIRLISNGDQPPPAHQ
jgi:hypothetical protein